MSHSHFTVKFTLRTSTRLTGGGLASRRWLPSALWAEDFFEGHLCGSPLMPARGRGERPRSGRVTEPMAGAAVPRVWPAHRSPEQVTPCPCVS